MRGLGELANVGLNAAVANAVFDATRKRPQTDGEDRVDGMGKAKLRVPLMDGPVLQRGVRFRRSSDLRVTEALKLLTLNLSQINRGFGIGRRWPNHLELGVCDLRALRPPISYLPRLPLESRSPRPSTMQLFLSSVKLTPRLAPLV